MRQSNGHSHHPNLMLKSLSAMGEAVVMECKAGQLLSFCTDSGVSFIVNSDTSVVLECVVLWKRHWAELVNGFWEQWQTPHSPSAWWVWRSLCFFNMNQLIWGTGYDLNYRLLEKVWPGWSARQTLYSNEVMLCHITMSHQHFSQDFSSQRWNPCCCRNSAGSPSRAIHSHRKR